MATQVKKPSQGGNYVVKVIKNKAKEAVPSPADFQQLYEQEKHNRIAQLQHFLGTTIEPDVIQAAEQVAKQAARKRKLTQLAEKKRRAELPPPPPSEPPQPEGTHPPQMPSQQVQTNATRAQQATQQQQQRPQETWTDNDQADYDRLNAEYLAGQEQDVKNRRLLKFAIKSQARKAVKKRLVARKAAAMAAKNVGRTAAVATSEATMGTTLAAWAIVEVGTAFVTHPIKTTKKAAKWGLYIAIAVAASVLFIFFFMVSLFMTSAGLTEQLALSSAEQNPLSVQKTGSDEVGNEGEIKYTISVSYPFEAEDVIVIDPLPIEVAIIPEKNTTIQCTPTNEQAGTPEYADKDVAPCVAGSREIRWSAKENGLTPPINTSFDVVVKALPSANDSWVVNTATGTTIITEVDGENLSASTTNCGLPEYQQWMDILPGEKKGLNYGDPACTFTRDGLASLLQQLDPDDALDWYCLAEHESKYNPNAYNPNSTSGRGAYGLFQMNPPGSWSEYDNGYVKWELQAYNAVTYRRDEINDSWAYWDDRSRARCPGTL